MSRSERRSIVFFTAHKCASVFVSDCIGALAADAGLQHINYEGYFAASDTSKYALFDDPAFQQRAFHCRGYYYGAFRWYHLIPNLEDYRVLLVLRDPRDVLTSYYYSMAFSHQVMSPGVLERRRAARDMGLDEYVLSIRGWLREGYDTFCHELLGRPNVLLARYEEMVTDFPRWMARVAQHLELDGNDQLVQDLVRQASFDVDGEDIHAHRRQVAPGEHRRKLRSDTVSLLDQEFRPILKQLGYVDGDGQTRGGRA